MNTATATTDPTTVAPDVLPHDDNSGEYVCCESCDKREFTDDTLHWCECADCDKTFACGECTVGWTKLERKYCTDCAKNHEGEHVPTVCQCCETEEVDEDFPFECFICYKEMCSDCAINMAGDSEHVTLNACRDCEEKPHPKHDLCACDACK